MQNGRPTVEQQAARIAREATMMGMDAPTLQVLLSMNEELRAIRVEIAEVQELVSAMSAEKDWYTTTEVAELMGVSRHHVTERWCNQARIKCEKDPESGHWRIPGHEYGRLKRGGRPLPPCLGPGDNGDNQG